MIIELSQLEPVSDIIHVSDTTNGNVQLINFDPTSNVVGGIEITLKLTVTLSDGTTWTKTYSITGV